MSDDTRRLRGHIDHLSAQIANCRAERDAAVGDRDRLAKKGRAFLNAYVNASVSDEEGLLASTDPNEWSALWRLVDDTAQEFGAALAGREGSDDADDAEIARVVRERDEADTGERVTLDEVLAEHGITRQQVEREGSDDAPDEPCGCGHDHARDSGCLRCSCFSWSYPKREGSDDACKHTNWRVEFRQPAQGQISPDPRTYGQWIVCMDCGREGSDDA